VLERRVGVRRARRAGPSTMVGVAWTASTDVERFVKRVRGRVVGWFRGAPDRRSGAWVRGEQPSGPRGQGGAPAAKRGRTTLTPGWRLLGHPGGPAGQGGCG
jgi:hypothetical protein